jgi:predicted RNA-binding protein with PUA-like domain
MAGVGLLTSSATPTIVVVRSRFPRESRCLLGAICRDVGSEDQAMARQIDPSHAVNRSKSIMTPKKNKAATRRYWLFKSEPTSYSIDDLAREPNQTTCWDGIRNYQARNLLRDDVHVGDRVFFYHSSSDPLAIVGTMEVVRAAYPDDTSFDPRHPHYDEKSRREEPTWYMVDVRLLHKFPTPVTRDMLTREKALGKMMLLQRGSRLSIQPVTEEQWDVIHRLAGDKLNA